MSQTDAPTRNYHARAHDLRRAATRRKACAASLFGACDDDRQNAVIIGLTGGIGSGKSVVGRMLADLGAHVIDTDKVAHAVYQPGTEGFRRIVAAFGDAVLAPDGMIDRKKLAAVVFADADRRQALNAIVHPLVFAAVMREIGERRAAGFQGHVVLEAPVLLEAKGAGMVDRIWVVAAPREAVHARLAASRDLTPEDIDARIDAQLSDAERRTHADLVIENDGDLTALRARVEAAWRALDAPETRDRSEPGRSS